MTPELLHIWTSQTIRNPHGSLLSSIRKYISKSIAVCIK